MAITISNGDASTVAPEPFTITKVRSTIVQDGSDTTATLAVPHGGPDGREPFYVSVNKVSDEGELLSDFSWSTDTANNEVDFDITISAAGTNEDEIVVDWLFWFLPASPDVGRSAPVGYSAFPSNTNF